eukprot:1793844-Pleurochrysis_carterae.AAC.1
MGVVQPYLYKGVELASPGLSTLVLSPPRASLLARARTINKATRFSHGPTGEGSRALGVKASPSSGEI